jgi:uncharacterized protein (TIGR02145 family)
MKENCFKTFNQRRSKMRKNLSLAISLGIAMLASFTLFACGDKEKKESAKDAAVEQPQAAEPAKEAPPPAPPRTGTMTDPRNGKTYKTVVIGKQTWMAENLAVAYENAFCEPDDDYCLAGEKGFGEVEDNGKYGKLYTPYLAQTACPSGWHLPSQSEWNELIAFAGGENAATALKGKSGWKTNGTDEFEFNALPGGFKRNKIGDGDFSPVATKDVGVAGNWWSSTEAGSGKYHDFHIDDKPGVRTDKDGCTNDNGWKNCYLLSVRCIKD